MYFETPRERDNVEATDVEGRPALRPEGSAGVLSFWSCYYIIIIMFAIKLFEYQNYLDRTKTFVLESKRWYYRC